MKNHKMLGVLLLLTLAGALGSILFGILLWNVPTHLDAAERLYHTCTVVAECWIALGSVGLVLFFLWEGRHFIKTLESSNYSHIYNRLDNINSLLVEHVIDRGLDLSQDVPDDYDFPFTDTRTHLCDMIFTLYEEVYYQWSKFQTLDEEDWAQWRRSIQSIFTLPYVRKHWEHGKKDTYPLKFQQKVEELRKQKPTSGRPEVETQASAGRSTAPRILIVPAAATR